MFNKNENNHLKLNLKNSKSSKDLNSINMVNNDFNRNYSQDSLIKNDDKVDSSRPISANSKKKVSIDESKHISSKTILSDKIDDQIDFNQDSKDDHLYNTTENSIDDKIL